jgi:hypothetical protein
MTPEYLNMVALVGAVMTVPVLAVLTLAASFCYFLEEVSAGTVVVAFTLMVLSVVQVYATVAWGGLATWTIGQVMCAAVAVHAYRVLRPRSGPLAGGERA